MFIFIDIVKKICSFASDGASVMMGKNTGVATRIAQINPFLYITHCIAHRLSLACGDAQEQVEFCKSVESVMKKVYLFFSKSSKCCDLLKHYQKFLINIARKKCKDYHNNTILKT